MSIALYECNERIWEQEKVWKASDSGRGIMKRTNYFMFCILLTELIIYYCFFEQQLFFLDINILDIAIIYYIFILQFHCN